MRHGVFARRRQVVAVRGGPLAEQRVGDLDQDARAVAQQRVGADRAAMVEVAEDFQRLSARSRGSFPP